MYLGGPEFKEILVRLSRERFFDLIELVGRAVATARQRPVDESWLDDFAPGWLKGRPKPEPRPESPSEDEFGLFDGSPWADRQDDSARTDLDAVAPGADAKFGFSEVERRKARRNRNEYGDSVASALWTLQREVAFRRLSVTDGLDELRRICDRLAGFISPGWAKSVRAVIDRCCL